MKLRQPQDQEPEISLTALIDVVFLLLIFFMISTSFNRESEINVDLPEATAEKQEAEQNVIDLTIDREGHFFINGKKVVNTRVVTLIKALKLVIKDQEKPALLISADGRTPHQAVVTAMDAARSLGINHLSLATKQVSVNTSGTQ